MGLSNYPPGVSGNEPQITGIWPAEQVVSGSVEELQRALNTAEDAVTWCEDQGMKFTPPELKRQDQFFELFQQIIDDINSRMPEDY